MTVSLLCWSCSSRYSIRNFDQAGEIWLPDSSKNCFSYCTTKNNPEWTGFLKQQHNCIQTSGVNRERNLNQIRPKLNWKASTWTNLLSSTWKTKQNLPEKENRIRFIPFKVLLYSLLRDVLGQVSYPKVSGLADHDQPSGLGAASAAELAALLSSRPFCRDLGSAPHLKLLAITGFSGLIPRLHRQFLSFSFTRFSLRKWPASPRNNSLTLCFAIWWRFALGRWLFLEAA